MSGGAGGAAMRTTELAVAGEVAGGAEDEGTSEGSRGGGGETLEGGQRARTSCELRALHLLTPWAEVQKPEDAGTPTPLCSALGARGHPLTSTIAIWYGYRLDTYGCSLSCIWLQARAAGCIVRPAVCGDRVSSSARQHRPDGPAHCVTCGRPPLRRPTHLLTQGCPLGPRGEPSGSSLRLTAWMPTGGCGSALVPRTQGC